MTNFNQKTTKKMIKRLKTTKKVKIIDKKGKKIAKKIDVDTNKNIVINIKEFRICKIRRY